MEDFRNKIVAVDCEMVGVGGFGGGGFRGGCPGRQRRRPEPLKPGANLEVDLKCSLEDLYTGATKRMKIGRKRRNKMGGYITDSKVLTVELKRGWKEGTKITFNKEGDEKPGYEAENIVFIIKVVPDKMEDFRNKIVAVDCEMVGVGWNGRVSVLARACVVSGRGQVLIDEYCSSEKRITDYRTRISGVEEKHMKNAQALSALQEKVKNAIAGKIVVGHGLKNDFQVLAIDHPESMKRDTAEYFLGKFARNKRPGLKQLARDQLGRTIQNGAHSPAIDAKAALDIYLKNREAWEATLALGSLSISRPTWTPTEYDDFDDLEEDILFEENRFVLEDYIDSDDYDYDDDYDDPTDQFDSIIINDLNNDEMLDFFM